MSFLVITYEDSQDENRKPVVKIDAVPSESIQKSPSVPLTLLPIDLYVQQSPNQLQIALNFGDPRGYDIQLFRRSAPSLPSSSLSSFPSEDHDHRAQDDTTPFNELREVGVGSSASSPRPRSSHVSPQPAHSPPCVKKEETGQESSATGSIAVKKRRKKRVACPLCTKSFPSKASRAPHLREHCSSILRQGLQSIVETKPAPSGAKYV